MPIARMRLNGFKCFADSGEIPLAPLTVIFGRNNTGKSSILQSLLLLRQTLDSPEYGPRLDLRGPLYPAGSYADIVHQHRSKQNVVMIFDVEGIPASRDMKLFNVEGVPTHSGTARIELEFSSDEPQPARLVGLKVSNGVVESLEICRGRGRGGPYELYIGGKSQGREKKALFRFPQNGFFPLIGPEPPRVGRPNQKHEQSRMFARLALQAFETTLRDMRAVGAFRRQPDRRYEYQGRVTQTIDATGRSVVDALIEDTSRRGRNRGELFRSVNKWLKEVGRVRLLPFKRISASARIFEVRLKDTDSGRWANFADVGFGVGQAFPVFVEGLRTSSGGMFLVQEPEIHLHPDAQLGMADFLWSLAASGRRVVVETHSENLLLRIRRRLMSRKTRLARKDVSILYVAKTLEGSSKVIPLEIDELAQIRNWPKGFMEEASGERLGLMKQVAKALEIG